MGIMYIKTFQTKYFIYKRRYSLSNINNSSNMMSVGQQHKLRHLNRYFSLSHFLSLKSSEYIHLFYI